MEEEEGMICRGLEGLCVEDVYSGLPFSLETLICHLSPGDEACGLVATRVSIKKYPGPGELLW